MIVLDTNVISEPLRSQPSPKVMEWLDNQAAETLFITAVSRAELRFGVLKLADGKRKNALRAHIDRVLNLFEDRMLSFDGAAADQLAIIAARSEKMGKRAVAPTLTLPHALQPGALPWRRATWATLSIPACASSIPGNNPILDQGGDLTQSSRGMGKERSTICATSSLVTFTRMKGPLMQSVIFCEPS